MIGTLLQNRCRLDAELGHGGMGTVYRPHDALLDGPVVLKVLSNNTIVNRKSACSNLGLQITSLINVTKLMDDMSRHWGHGSKSSGAAILQLCPAFSDNLPDLTGGRAESGVKWKVRRSCAKSSRLSSFWSLCSYWAE